MRVLNIEHFPENILIDNILVRLSDSDIAIISVVSKVFNRLANDEHLWKHCFRRDFSILFKELNSLESSNHLSKSTIKWKLLYKKFINSAFYLTGELKIHSKKDNKFYYTYTVRKLNENSTNFNKWLINKYKPCLQWFDISMQNRATIILSELAISIIAEDLLIQTFKSIYSNNPL